MKQKLVSLLLLLALLAGQLPAAATYTGSDKTIPLTGSVTVVNPLYGGTADEESPSDSTDSIIENPPNFRKKQAERGEHGASATAYYTDIADAAGFVRSQMANRQHVITLAYRTTGRSNS